MSSASSTSRRISASRSRLRPTSIRRRPWNLLNASERISTARGVSVARRCYIIGSGAGFDDTNVALLLAALEPIVDPATLMLHDPDDADALWFQRRPPGVVRGGIFLNSAWMGAGVRIAVGDPAQVLAGLAAWFVPRAELDPQVDLNADVILTPD